MDTANKAAHAVAVILSWAITLTILGGLAYLEVNNQYEERTHEHPTVECPPAAGESDNG